MLAVDWHLQSTCSLVPCAARADSMRILTTDANTRHTADEAGRVGCLLFGGVLIWCTHALVSAVVHALGGRRGDVSPVRVAFFASTWLCAFLELPRYILLATGRAYGSSDSSRVQKGVYSCHVASGVFFLGSFTLILSAFNHLFSGRSIRLLRREVLVCANLAFALLALANILLLERAGETLLHYFEHSEAFVAYCVLEGALSTAYSLAALYCIQRIGAYQQLARLHSPESEAAARLARTLSQLRRAMLVCACCFLLRIGMLLVKQLELHDLIGGASPGDDPLELFTPQWLLYIYLLPSALSTNSHTNRLGTFP